jgi:hypothetical protein
LTETVHVDGLDVTADRILHLDAVPRVFECNPLHTIAVLSHYEWRGSRDGTRGGARARPQRGCLVNVARL